MPKTLTSGNDVFIKVTRIDPRDYNKEFINGTLSLKIDNAGDLKPLFAIAQLENASTVNINSCLFDSTNTISLKCVKISDGSPYSGSTTGNINIVCVYEKVIIM